MNCLYCQQPTNLQYNYNGTISQSSYVCDTCNITYFLFDDKLSSYHIKYQQYEAWFYLDHNDFILFKNMSYGSELELVLRLDFHPTLTPQNISTRLPIFLTFLWIVITVRKI